jgi:hypothetical protein
MNINRERFIKPKIDKYIQLYSKKARAEEATQTIKLTGVVNIENGGKFYGSDQTATISAPLSGTQPTIQLTKVNGVITNAVLSDYSTAVYSPNNPPRLTITPLPTSSTSVKSIEIVNNGSGYSTAPSLRITYPPTARRAILTATCNDQGHVVAVGVIDGGAGYISTPTISVVSITPYSGDVLAVITPVITNGAISSVSITQQGTYDSRQVVVSVSEPNTTDIAKATCTIDTLGNINSVSITQAGLNYTSAPSIYIDAYTEGESAELRAYLTLGFGANLILDYEFVPSNITRYTWDLESPVELNENGTMQVIHREFFNVPQNDKGKLIVMRLHEVSSKSVVNTLNTSEGLDFNGGVIVDIGKEDRLLPNEIILEVNPQTIDRISLSLNHDISGTAGFHAVIEFLVILKVVEKEPSIIEYGALNNINFLQ